MEAGPLLPCVGFSHVDTLFVADAVCLELLYIFPTIKVLYGGITAFVDRFALCQLCCLTGT